LFVLQVSGGQDGMLVVRVAQKVAGGSDDEGRKASMTRRGATQECIHAICANKGERDGEITIGLRCNDLIAVRLADLVVPRAFNQGHAVGSAIALAVHPTLGTAVSAGEDGTLRLWELERGRPSALGKRTVQDQSTGENRKLQVAAWAPDGSIIAVSALEFFLPSLR
jgi:WD40 repeat protein